ncbi:lysozyme inhibitor LprI family protein [Hyphomicrobium sp.]|jgi:uncharacterized protein YecT (DUF1311 family)|uniref:lysozyme inhibitor LprI family protein n=1 Tax=Hyphomicrobium sp. TaxID=82 RepID=UPI003562A0B4
MPRLALKYRMILLFAGLASLTFAHPAAAETIDCANAMATVELNFCADKEYQAADKALNAEYALALKSVRSRTLERPYDAKSAEDALKTAQRAWIAYRDADCKGVVAQVWTNGTGATSAILMCMTDKTQQRTKELNAQFQEN